MSDSLKDKIAIVGMGCVKFGENWEQGSADMMVDAAYEALEDAGVGLNDIQAAWKGSVTEGLGEPMAYNLKFDHIPITRVENACITGADAFRLACFGIASGTYDLVMALGCEKMRDAGSINTRWIIRAGGGPSSMLTSPSGGAVTTFARIANRYMDHYGIDYDEFKSVLAKIAVKNHHNGSLNPKAYDQSTVKEEDVVNARMLSWPLGMRDCCIQSDGCAVAILSRADMAKNFRDDYILVKGIGQAVGSQQGNLLQDHELLQLEETVRASQQAYEQAGIKDPAKEIDVAEVHDSFTITELISMEDLGFCPRGEAKEYIKEGRFNLDGDLAVNPDGGLLSFGHPMGATGLRMIYEVYKQMQGKADKRQRKNPSLGLAHNFGLMPGSGISSVIVLGQRD